MRELTAINKLDLCAIPELCGKNFFIPNYQRGYRWGEVQVRQLLEDLFSFAYDDNAKGDFYCLQPVVIKEMSPEEVAKQALVSELDDNRWYEVIDGQQRLTTIRIILALEGILVPFKKKSFRIEYQTRPNLKSIYNELNVVQDSETGKAELSGGDRYGDIDSWHIVQSAKLILNWFQGGRDARTVNELDKFAGRFYETFIGERSDKKSVQVIWYQLNDDSDPYEVFKRLNDKKVSLNNAELIRGMFLSDSSLFRTDPELLCQFDEEIRPVIEKREQLRKQSHIIEQWDIIENQLRNDRFWAFIKSDNDTQKYSCRIEYIFDLISQKDENEKDALYTYLEFERLLKEESKKDLWNLWQKVEACHARLKAWFGNFDHFHKIGYLITLNGAKILIELLHKSERETKTDFNKYIEQKIKETVADRKDIEGKRCILDYSYDEDYELLKKVLFLYNVESTRRLGSDPFPFEKYKRVKNWTLEHIHAQNSEMIDRSDKNKWNIWFKENSASLELLLRSRPDDRALENTVRSIRTEYDRFSRQKAKYSYTDVTKVFDRVLAYFNGLCENRNKARPMHNITNIALLDGKNNSAISNSVFEVKRQMILNSDACGNYIPICTRNVFLKYYNRKDPTFTVHQNFYWGETDRLNYHNDICEVMAPYLYPAKKEDEQNLEISIEHAATNE